MKSESPSQAAKAAVDLLDAARRGRDNAFGKLFETFRSHLLLLAHRELPLALRGKVGPSDLVQETALDAQQDFPRFRGSTTEECFAWLRAILRNNVVDAVRRYQTAQKRTSTKEISLATAAGRKQGDMVELLHSLPDKSAIRRENAGVLAAVMTRLSEDHRTVLELRYWEGLSFPEIGAKLGRSADAARKLWYRAVERLQAEMNDETSRGNGIADSSTGGTFTVPE